MMHQTITHRLLIVLILCLFIADLHASDIDVATQVGVNIHFTQPKAGEMKLLGEGGFKWIRMDFTWQAVENQKGIYNFDNYDVLVKELQDHNHHILLILDYGNKLYDNGMAPFTDAGRQAFANFVTATVDRYKDKGIYWELWNEPNHRFFWKPYPKVEAYIELAKVVGKVFKEQFPGEVLVGPATSRIAFDFLEPCFKAGLLEYFSFVTVHPYRQAAPQTVESEYQQLRMLIERYKPKGKSIGIISGEWGYSSVWNDFTPEKQAKMLARQWLTNIANDIHFSIWYDWHDDGRSTTDPEQNFGTVRHEYLTDANPCYEPKPAFLAARTFTTLLKGYHFNKQLVLDSGNDHLLLFAHDNQLMLAAWTSGDQHDALLPASAGTFEAWDHLGNALPPMQADENGLKISLSDSVTYLKPQTPNTLLQLATNWQRLPLSFIAAAPAQLTFNSTLHNAASQAVTIAMAGKEQQTLAPGESVTDEQTVTIQRSSSQPDVITSITINGQKITQKASVMASNPLNLMAMPGSDRSVQLMFANPAAQPFSGKVIVTDDRNITLGSTPINLPASDVDTTLTLATTQTMPIAARLSITLTDNAGNMVANWKQAYDNRLSQEMVDGLWKLLPGGDNKVNATLHMSIKQAPEPSPAGDMPVFAIDYQFDPGSKYLWFMPTRDHLKKLEKEPAFLGFWVYGDANELCPVTRFADATGQKFQPKGDIIKQTGWRYVRLPLNNANVWHYGGAKDGIIHYPIQFESLLIFDTTKRDKASQGTLYITMPTLIWDE